MKKVALGRFCDAPLFSLAVFCDHGFTTRVAGAGSQPHDRGQEREDDFADRPYFDPESVIGWLPQFVGVIRSLGVAGVAHLSHLARGRGCYLPSRSVRSRKQRKHHKHEES
jgi:hypothetical protein